MPFPLIKLGTLLGKQLSKPLANGIKKQIKSSSFVRDKICVPLAQKYHRMTVSWRSRLLGIGKVQTVEPLSVERAVDLVADMMGEVIIFSVAVGAIYLESSRKSRNDDAKETKQNMQIETLEEKVKELELTTSTLQTQLQDIKSTLNYSKEGILKRLLDGTEDTQKDKDERVKL